MKNQTSLLLAGLALATGAATARADLQLDFSGLVQSSINFNSASDSFQFQNSSKSANQWYVNNQSGGTGSGIGLLGTFGTGSWSIGSATTVNGVETASVTTSSAFQLSGLSGMVSSGTLTESGGIASLTFNLTGLTYSGNNSDLLTLSKSGKAAVDVTFVLGANGFDVNGNNPTVLAYTGTVFAPSAVPEATTSLAGAGALGLLFLGTDMIRRNAMSREGKNNQ